MNSVTFRQLAENIRKLAEQDGHSLSDMLSGDGTAVLRDHRQRDVFFIVRPDVFRLLSDLADLASDPAAYHEFMTQPERPVSQSEAASYREILSQ